MHRALIAFVFVSFTLGLSAQTSVWKVTRGDSMLYLGGTCHVLRASDFPLPAEFDHAYAAATAIYFETDLKRVDSPEMQQIVLTRGVFPEGTTLETSLSAEAWAVVQTYCEKKGMPPARIAPLRPWLFTVMVAQMELQKLGVTAEGVDLRYFRQATADAKTIGELETFERHIDFITAMGAGRESEMIVHTLEDLDRAAAELPALLSAWRSGDLAKIETLLIAELREKFPDLHQQLLVQRNHDWMPVITRLLATPETEFVLAGVGHMAGPDGLIALLQASGCTVEQIKVPAAVGSD